MNNTIKKSLNFWDKDDQIEKKEENTTNSNFTTLAPTILTGDSLGNNEVYLSALKEVIDIPENKNIALMGNYGSGKSSILKTFEKKNPDYRYLFLSLASFFKKESDTEDLEQGTQGSETNNNRKSETWEKIENILVKQMIYKKEIKDLPYSRFKRITDIPKSTIQLNSILVILFSVLVISTLFFNQTIEVLMSWEVVPYLIILGVSYYFLNKLLMFLSIVYKHSKFSFKSFSIEPIKGDSSSFSRYLDEIIYFFEVSKTDIVVIEDIDRFNSIEIFEHLRELNYLLNNSDQVEQHVTFIYAVRNDLFNIENDSNLKESEEYLRTKFFDFIIPIIPVVDFKNSRDFMVPKVREIMKRNCNGGEINFNKNIERFLWGISLYIDDLRLIYNICNEFELYLKRLQHINTNEKIKKLFALIVYKNVYPEDFSALQRNKGNLYNVFHSIKKDILDNRKKVVEKSIQKNRDILEGSNYGVSKLAQTAILYLFLNKDNNSNLQGIYYSTDIKNTYPNVNKSIFPITKNVINDFLKVKDSMLVRTSRGKFSISEEEINESFQRFGVNTDAIIEELELDERAKRHEKIQQLLNEIRFLNTLTVKDLINEETNNEEIININFERYNLLIKHLLSEGYIDEQYIYFMSILYENALSINDLGIIQKLKSNTKINEDEELNNYELALYELSENDYKKPSILNKNIVLYIFNKDIYIKEQYSVIDVFLHKINISGKIEFLQRLFTESAGQTQRFISRSFQKKNDLFETITSNTSSDSNFKEELIYRIFASCEYELLQSCIVEDERLKLEAEKIPRFAINLNEKYSVRSDNIKNIFSINKFKFIELGLKEMNQNDFLFYLKKSLYKINSINVFDIYERLSNNLRETFSISDLLSTDIKQLTECINENFDEFTKLLNEIEELYENNNVFLRILNDSTVSEELKISIIKKNIYILESVEKINNLELRRNVFKHEKFIVSLNNVMKASSEEVKYIIPYFKDPDKIQDFIDEAKQELAANEDFEEEIIKFMNSLVNNHNLEINEDNIDFFKMNNDYSVEGMNDKTFYFLLNEDSINPKLENSRKLSGKKKVDLLSQDEENSAKIYNHLSISEEEIIIGLSIFKEDMMNKIVAASFENGKLGIGEKTTWLKEIHRNKIILSADKIKILFMYEDLIESDILLKYLGFAISKDILSDKEILENIKKIDDSFSQIKIGLQGKKKVNKKYHELLKLLKQKGIISSFYLEGKSVIFHNKRK